MCVLIGIGMTPLIQSLKEAGNNLKLSAKLDIQLKKRAVKPPALFCV